jgi:hypothetical protein
MPIKEATIFKDGHTFVVHQGRVPVDTKGLSRLSAAVLFSWACVA